MLEAGAEVDEQDNKGMCPLHWAAHRAHLDTVNLLLEAKAYPNNIGSLKLEESEEVTVLLNIIQNKTFAQVQLTPLDSALMAEREELVSMLMDHGAVTIARIHNVAATRIQVFFSRNQSYTDPDINQYIF